MRSAQIVSLRVPESNKQNYSPKKNPFLIQSTQSTIRPASFNNIQYFSDNFHINCFLHDSENGIQKKAYQIKLKYINNNVQKKKVFTFDELTIATKIVKSSMEMVFLWNVLWLEKFRWQISRKAFKLFANGAFSWHCTNKQNERLKELL